MKTPLTNDQLRLEFARIYGRLPSVCELMQFKQNRPARYFDPPQRKPKGTKLVENETILPLDALL